MAQPEPVDPDLSSPAYVKGRIRDAKQDHLSRVEVWKGMLATERGRKVMYDLLASCHLGANPFSKDSLVMAYQCGEMNVALQLLPLLMNDLPDLYLTMLKENANG